MNCPYFYFYVLLFLEKSKELIWISITETKNKKISFRRLKHVKRKVKGIGGVIFKFWYNFRIQVAGGHSLFLKKGLSCPDRSFQRPWINPC